MKEEFADERSQSTATTAMLELKGVVLPFFGRTEVSVM